MAHAVLLTLNEDFMLIWIDFFISMQSEGFFPPRFIEMSYYSSVINEIFHCGLL